MSELLAPAGNREALKAAIACGCDAVYLGMEKFGARAYSDNFDEEALREAVDYAHLRGVKVYVTVNTIVFDDELPEVYRCLHRLNDMGVDGVIVQDLAVLAYVARHFEDMEAHCSTQMGIDDAEGALLAKELGAKRVVVAREASMSQVREIRRRANIPVEIFVHGALCVSYSGNCIMSGMTGNRSGNRGRCIGSCRKLYDIFDVTDGEEAHGAEAGCAGLGAGVLSASGGQGETLLGRNYVLSTKDLNTVEYVREFEGIDSLKIEGRMKEPIYVANVVSRYRKALDGCLPPAEAARLNRTFNRTFTKGYLFGEDRGDIANVERPNHFGYRIGAVRGKRKGLYEIQLDSPLRQGDAIRIRHAEEDVNLVVAKLYDPEGRLINAAEETCCLRLRERLKPGDVVYKTKDVAYEKELEGGLQGEFRRFPLNVAVYAYPDAPLVVVGEGLGQSYSHTSDEILSAALKQPTSKEAVIKQLARLNDTVFALGEVEYEDCGAFIPAKMLNAARKDIVENLYALRLVAKPRRVKSGASGDAAGGGLASAVIGVGFAGAASAAVADADELAQSAARKPYLTAQVITQEQYDACRECGIETVYFRNVIPRNGGAYCECDRECSGEGEGELLVGGLGGVYRYRQTNPLVGDYSLNVVNAQSALELGRLGVRRVTLSYEINRHQLRGLVDACGKESCEALASPALEMIVYGHAPLLVTKYCPLKKLGQCGVCRTRRYEIRDEFGAFPVLMHENCDTTILNGKVLNLLDEMPAIEGVEAFRLSFTLESPEQVRAVIAKARGKLEGTLTGSTFNPETDTRGYFNRDIL